jgi:LacI family transcriptional regulator
MVSKQVALLIDLDNPRVWNIARGVIKVANQNQWLLYGYGSMLQPIGELESWQGDGLIALIKSQVDMDRVLRLGLPTVDVAGAIFHSHVARVLNDDRAIGSAAGDHLLLGFFQSYAYCGIKGLEWAERREKGFRQSIAPYEVEKCYYESLGFWESAVASEALNTWLRNLASGTALLCCHDAAACKVSRACAQLGIVIPQQLAIMGIDNDEVLCELSHPTLSSIPLNVQELGVQAALMLEKLWLEASPKELLLPPLALELRQSTNIIHCQDRKMEMAMMHIRRCSCSGLNVSELLDHVHLSRRSLEQRFKKAFGLSPLQAITQVKIDKAKELLKDHRLPSQDIAQQCGYRSLGCFYTAFKRETGCAPLVYRDRLQQR